METKLPKPKRLTLRRKSDGATKFPRVVTQENAAQVVAEVVQERKEQIPDAPVQTTTPDATDVTGWTAEHWQDHDDDTYHKGQRHVQAVRQLTERIVTTQVKATELYRSLVWEVSQALACNATETEVRQTIIGAGWTASRASEVLKVASLPPAALQDYLSDGMSWRLALAAARMPLEFREDWERMNQGLFQDDIPQDAPLPPPGLLTGPTKQCDACGVLHPANETCPACRHVVSDANPPLPGLTATDHDLRPVGATELKAEITRLEPIAAQLDRTPPLLGIGHGASDPEHPAHAAALERGAQSPPEPLVSSLAPRTRGPAKPYGQRVLVHLAAIAKLFRAAGLEHDSFEIGGCRLTIEPLKK